MPMTARKLSDTILGPGVATGLEFQFEGPNKAGVVTGLGFQVDRPYTKYLLAQPQPAVMEAYARAVSVSEQHKLKLRDPCPQKFHFQFKFMWSINWSPNSDRAA